MMLHLKSYVMRRRSIILKWWRSNPAQTVRCKKKLEGSPVHVGAAIGFPLGQTTLECKIFETKDAIEKGADEIDYVINVAELKNKIMIT